MFYLFHIKKNGLPTHVLAYVVFHSRLLKSLLSISVSMACIGKIIIAFVILQVAMVLAKPYEPYDDGLYHSNEDVEDYVYKRTQTSKRRLNNLPIVFNLFSFCDMILNYFKF